jgi:ParB/RepB/Spo0J family partition protein
MTTAEFKTLPLTKVHESKDNPRRHYDEGKLKELTDNIREHGIQTPLLVRPNVNGFEIASGHRRYRAAKAAGLTEVPGVVRVMTDTEFWELINFDNLHREDVTPMEQAAGYKLLMTKAHYTVAKIAERVGVSERYVYDRIRLTNLSEPLQTALASRLITVGHAIVLARLTSKQQEAAMHKQTGGLFTHEDVLEEEGGRAIAARLKAVSVGELEGWIDQHIRFDTSAVDPMLFPDTAEIVDGKGRAQEETIVKITSNFYVQDMARDPKERTIGPMSWRRADGKRGSKTCDEAVTGVVVVGPGRGQAFKVCLDKKGCAKHWAAEQRLSRQRAKDRDRAPRATSPERDAARDKAQAATLVAARAREGAVISTTLQRLWKTAWTPSAADLRGVCEAVLDYTDTGPLLATLFGVAWEGATYGYAPKAKQAIHEAVAKMASGPLLRFIVIAHAAHEGELTKRFVAFAKSHKVDVAAIEKDQVKAAKAAAQAVKAGKAGK